MGDDGVPRGWDLVEVGFAELCSLGLGLEAGGVLLRLLGVLEALVFEN